MYLNLIIDRPFFIEYSQIRFWHDMGLRLHIRIKSGDNQFESA